MTNLYTEAMIALGLIMAIAVNAGKIVEALQ